MERAIIPINFEWAEKLSVLSKNIYVQHYLHLWEAGGADWYMHEYAYNVDVLKAELLDPNNLHFIVFENQEAIGYLKLQLVSKNAENALEIERIYLYENHMGKGIGKELMLYSQEIAIKQQKKSMVLKAMDTSKAAIGFYQKMGFEIIATTTLPFELMKKPFRGMVTLQKNLD